MKIEQRTTDTVLAALRAWQKISRDTLDGSQPELKQWHAIANNDHNEPLSPDEIDELCEALNCGDIKLFTAAWYGPEGKPTPEPAALTEAEVKAILDPPAEPEADDGMAIDNPRPTAAHYIEAARRMYAMRSSDDLEIDDAPALSETDTGSWVAAWVYVRDEDVRPEDIEEAKQGAEGFPPAQLP